jgi:hypothetical protein
MQTTQAGGAKAGNICISTTVGQKYDENWAKNAVQADFYLWLSLADVERFYWWSVNTPRFSCSLELRHVYHLAILGSLAVFEAKNTLLRRDYQCHKVRAIARSIRA